MDLMQSPEQDEIQRTVASFLAEKFPVRGHGHETVRSVPEIADDLWAACCELGWLGLGVAESMGGVGYGLAEEAILFRELGRGLAPGPFLPGVIAAHVAAAAGDDALVGRIVSGDARVAMGTPYDNQDATTEFSGELSLVHVEKAELVVVTSMSGSAIYKVSDFDIASIDPVDLSVSIATGQAKNAKALHYVPVKTSNIYARANVLAAAMAVGIAAEVMRIAVEYSKTREQFGKPIGSFQTLKNYAAYMVTRCELAESQLFFAALAVEGDFENALSEAQIARYTANEAARLNGEHSVQMHGGYGYTTEYTPYRFVTRAHTLERMIEVRSRLLDNIVTPLG